MMMLNLYSRLSLLLSIASSTVTITAAPFSPSSRETRSSLLLPRHRRALDTYYRNRRPHDTTLYDDLNVNSNATLSDIQKSWRRKSLEWHPDKVALRRRDEAALSPQTEGPGGSQDVFPDDDEMTSYARRRLHKIQQAYEILSDDRSRLLYHKYGLIAGTDAAVLLLTGRGGALNTNYEGLGSAAETGEQCQCRLLELMGYVHHHNHASSSTTTSNNSQQKRIHHLTTSITETLRPLVEGTISQETFINQFYSEMNTLKTSPFGAHIIRCVGRAYKIEGWRVLRQMKRDERERHQRQQNHHHQQQHHHHHHPSALKRRNDNNVRIDNILQDSWRNTKHYASAVYASCKLIITEQRMKKFNKDQLRLREERRKKKRKCEEEETKKSQQCEEGSEGVKRTQIRKIEDEDDETDMFSLNIGSLSSDEEEEIDDELGIGDSILDIDIELSSESEESDDHDEIEYELQHIQNQKAYTAILSLHQMEALWKVTKIELDRTVREACRWILLPTTSSGWYAFCPSEQSPYAEDWQHYARPKPPTPPPPPPFPSRDGDHHHHNRRHRHQHHRQRRRMDADGWVGLNGEVVPMEVGRLRAAAAMVLVGDIMVRCSKEGTAWRNK